MRAKRKNFIVLCVGDKNSYGYDEETLPLLLQLVDSSAPDARVFTHTAVIAYYLSSRQALAAVEQVISRAETLRDTNAKFSGLGIGLAREDLMARFDWLGRLKRDSTPNGGVARCASSATLQSQRYKEVLKELHQTLR